MAAPIDILHLVPELAAIGQEKLQIYCNEWLKRPIAKQTPLVQIVVDEQLMLSLHVPVDAEIAALAFIPMDELLGYIIDQQFQPDERRQLHAKVRESRAMLARLGTQYEVMAGRMGLLYLDCKNPDCNAMILTSHRGIEGQTIACLSLPATCPICGQEHFYDGSDFRLRIEGF